MTGEYPEIITAEILDQYSHRSDQMMAHDISIKKSVIKIKESRVKEYADDALRYKGTAHGKLAAYKRDLEQDELDHKKEYLAYLERVQMARKEQGDEN